MEFQKSGGNAAALFQRPGFGSPQQWAPPQQAQPGYQPLPQQGYPQTTPQGYQLPGPQEYQQTAPQGYQQPSPQGYLETTPQGYQQTAPQQPAEQVYQQPSPQVYQPTSPQGYRQSSPQGYQQTPQPGYLQPARVVSPRSPQPTAQPGYEQTSQQGYSIQAKPAYQTPVEPTGQQTPQPAYASAVDSVYQPLAQPASQPDYQQTPQPVQQQAVFQPTVRPVHSPQSQPVYRPPAAQLVHVQSPPQGASPVLAPAAQTANLAQPAVPQAQVAATPVTPPAEPGLDAYLEAQLKITQSPPSSAGSARRPGSLPHCASNLSNQSADGQAANTLGQRASSETPGSGETLRGAAQEQTDLDRQAAYPILAQSPSGSDKQVSPPARSPPSRPVQSPPPEKVQFQAWEYVPPEGGQPPVEPLPNVAQPVPAARVSTPPAFPPASGAPPVSVFHFERLTQPQPMSYPPQVSQASPVFSPQADILQEANNISPREASPHPPLSPPPLAHTFTPQPSPTTPPQRGIYSQSSDQSSLASFSSAGTGPVNTAPQQWQPDPLLAPAAIWVNGHRLTEELTSAAEVLAGPIERGGFYWYDPVAGFWGEYGKPCQGILPVSRRIGHPLNIELERLLAQSVRSAGL